MENFLLTISTPQDTVFEGEVKNLKLTTEGGDVDMMAHHASLTGTIAFTPLVLEHSEGQTETYMVRNGLVLFDNKTNEARVLALYAEAQSAVSEQTIEDYVKFVETQLREGKDLSEFQVKYLEGEKLAVEQQLAQLKK